MAPAHTLRPAAGGRLTVIGANPSGRIATHQTSVTVGDLDVPNKNATIHLEHDELDELIETLIELRAAV